MTQISGAVQKIGKNERYGLFSIQVDGSWYGCGKINPETRLAVGDDVTFSASQNDKGYWNVDMNTVERTARNAPAAGSSPAQGSGSTAAITGSDAMNLTTSRRHALDIVSMALEQGAITLGKTQAKQFDIIEATVDRMINKYYDQYQNGLGDGEGDGGGGGRGGRVGAGALRG